MPEARKSIGMLCRVLRTGGVSSVALQEQNQFIENGVDSTLYFLRDTGCDINDVKRVIVLNATNHSRRLVGALLWKVTQKFAGHRGQAATVDLDYILKSYEVLKNHDRVVFHDQWSALVGLFLRIKGIPYILLLHEFFRPPPGMKRGNPLAILAWLYDLFSIKIAPAVATTSQFNYRIIKKFQKRTYLVRIGMPIPKRNLLDTSKFMAQRKKVLSITLWDKGRYPEFYTQLAQRLPHLDFVIAGSWTVSDEEIEFKKKYGNIINLTVTGKIDEFEKERLLLGSHFYIRLGYNERGPGMGGLEAMSYGLIPIANDSLGLSEILVDGSNGFVINEPLLENSVRILDYLNSMSSEQLLAISQKNFDICDSYSWRENALSLERIFGDIDHN
ncbi:MAG: glycosyltransferase [Thermoplasmataceae archaeon]